MNRRYVIAGAAVVGVAGLWFMFGQSGGGGGTSSTTTGGTAAAGAGPQISGQTAAGGSAPTDQLYGSATATLVVGPSGTLANLATFGRPRDVFVQIVGTSSGSSSSMTFGTTPTTTKTQPISLGSGTPTAVPSTGSGSGTSGTPTTSTTTPAPSSTGQTLAAEFDINGEPVVAYDGDSIPPETQQFTVKSMTKAQVTLTLNGALLASGASSIVIKVGQTITLSNQTAHSTTVIHLISVHAA